jgi:hypothetical protein
MAIANGYASLIQVKAAARIGTADTIDDGLLELSIEAASRMIDAACERRFYTGGTETRYYSAADSTFVDVDDLAGTAITVKSSSPLDGVYDVTWAATDLQFEPSNRTSSGLSFPITRLRAVGDYAFPTGAANGVEVTGVFGFGTAIPTAITQACVILSLRQFKRYDSPTGVLGFGDMGAVRVGRVDPDVQALIAAYRRNVPGVA